MAADRRLPAAAPAAVAALLAGPERRAPVVHRGAAALYVDVGDRVLGVLAAAAAPLPCGLRTTEPRLPAALLRPAAAVVGDGRLRAGGVDVVVTRLVGVTVPRLPTGPEHPRSALRRLDDAVGARLDGVRAELPAGALAALAAGRAEAVPPLLGRGSGLTPVGDDVLCGWLATTTAATGEPPAAMAAAVATRAARSTTALSATLLDCAARGEVLPELRQLLLDLADPGGSDVADRVASLLRVGHTSGAGLLLGARLALEHVAPLRSTPRQEAS